MSEKLLASISFSSFSGDSLFPFDWGLFLCLPILGVFCLFVCLFVSTYWIDLLLLLVFMGWLSVVGVLWDPVVQSP